MVCACKVQRISSSVLIPTKISIRSRQVSWTRRKCWMRWRNEIGDITRNWFRLVRSGCVNNIWKIKHCHEKNIHSYFDCIKSQSLDKIYTLLSLYQGVVGYSQQKSWTKGRSDSRRSRGGQCWGELTFGTRSNLCHAHPCTLSPSCAFNTSDIPYFCSHLLSKSR